MRRRDLLKMVGAAAVPLALPLASPSFASFGQPRRPKRILYFTRNVGYYHSVVRRTGDAPSHSERALTELGRRAGIEVECTKDGRVFDGDLDRFDAFAFYTNNDPTAPNDRGDPPMTGEGKRRFLDAVARGKGFLAFHSACACWRTPGPAKENRKDVDPYIAMIGGEFIEHGPQQEAVMRVASPEFPGMRGLAPSFRLTEEWYAVKNFADDLHVILVQETAGMRGACYQRPPYPSTWARRHGEGRVYVTTMAHRENVWVEDPFQQIVLGALAWIVGDVDADLPANLDAVTPRCRELATGSN